MFLSTLSLSNMSNMRVLIVFERSFVIFKKISKLLFILCHRWFIDAVSILCWSSSDLIPFINFTEIKPVLIFLFFSSCCIPLENRFLQVFLLNFLLNRKLSCRHETRHWFHKLNVRWHHRGNTNEDLVKSHSLKLDRNF